MLFSRVFLNHIVFVGVIVFSGGAYSVRCDYSTKSDLFVKTLQTDIYNDKSWIELKDINGNTSEYKVYDGDKSNIEMMMDVARLSLILKNKVSVCYYNDGTYNILYNLQISE